MSLPYCPLCKLPPWRPDSAGGCDCSYEQMEAALRTQVVYAELIRVPAERMVQAYRDWMAGCDNEPRTKDVMAAHIALRDALAKNPVTNPSGVSHGGTSASGEASGEGVEGPHVHEIARKGSEVRLDSDGKLDEVVGSDAVMENLERNHWFIEIGDVAVWLHSKSPITATYERRQIDELRAQSGTNNQRQGADSPCAEVGSSAPSTGKPDPASQGGPSGAPSDERHGAAQSAPATNTEESRPHILREDSMGNYYVEDDGKPGL